MAVRTRIQVLLVIIAVMAGLGVPVGSLAAPEGPQLVANGNFASPDLGGWEPTEEAVIGRTGTATFQGSHALEVTSSGGDGSGVATVARHATASGPHVLTLAVKGNATSVGQVVRASITDPATGGTSVSAPVHLQPWWQTVGVTATTTGSALEFAVEEQASGGLSPVASWSAGDSWLVDAVRARAQGPTEVTTQGRQLLVDSEPFTMKGYVYMSEPIGGAGFGVGPSWNTNPAQCQADANMLRAAGVNTLRIWYTDPGYDPDTYAQCMDAFHAAGIKLMWILSFFGVQVQHDAARVQDTDLYVEAYWEGLRLAVERLKDHPATLGYNIGNEMASQQPESRGWFDQLDELARRTKRLDPHHVTTTSMNFPQFFGASGPGGNGVSPGDAPHVDLWGFNHKGGVNGYGPLFFEQIADQDPTRPVWMSEYGTDRYWCHRDFSSGIFNLLWAVACGPVSGEAQGVQADFDVAQWRDIAANLSADDPTGAVVGGVAFMWSDLWWFAFPGISGAATSPATHDVGGVGSPNPLNGNRSPGVERKYADAHFSPEFNGVAYALTPDQPGPRGTTTAHDRLADEYTGTSGPVVSQVAVASVTGCDATLTWATDVPTFSRADAGAEQIVTVQGLIVQDNTVLLESAQGTALTMSHQVSLDGLAPATTYRAHVRGLDEHGRPGSALPVTFTTADDASCQPAASS